MKKTTAMALALLIAAAGMAQAASVITPSLYSISKDQSQMVIKLACTAHTDGTFTSQQITHAALFASGSVLPVQYQHMGYYLYEVWAINPASGDGDDGGRSEQPTDQVRRARAFDIGIRGG